MNKRYLCRILDDFAEKYGIEIRVMETINGTKVLFADRSNLWCDTYILSSFDPISVASIINEVKRKLNSKANNPAPYIPEIKNVVFNEPATIILWADGTKTVVKCQEGEGYDPEKGMAMAISKKALGNKSKYYEVFKKWLPEEEEVNDGRVSSKDLCKAIEEFAKVANKHKIGL